MTYIIVCGGTAGHVNPGITIADGIKEREPDAEVLFIGAGRELENRLIPAAGYKLINLKMTGIRRGYTLSALIQNIKTIKNVLIAQRTAAKIIKRHRPKAVIGTGGYVCYPVIKKAAKLKIPTFIHESNARPGMTVRKLSAIADKVMITYPGYEDCYKRREHITVTGTPVRREIIDIISQTGRKRSKNGKSLVISFWGSLGAERMNAMMEDFIKQNTKDESFYHIHATGTSKGTFSLTTNPPYADIREYIDDMPKALTDADLVLCRAGGITLAELTAAGKPSVLVPSPYVPDNVQAENAKQLSDNGAAVMLDETECTGELLYKTVLKLIQNKDKLEKMSEAAEKIGKPDATNVIIDTIMSNC